MSGHTAAASVWLDRSRRGAVSRTGRVINLRRRSHPRRERATRAGREVGERQPRQRAGSLPPTRVLRLSAKPKI
eukprot:scaffold101225_cov31-Tisochrysis_lutea.AAC.1